MVLPGGVQVKPAQEAAPQVLANDPFAMPPPSKDINEQFGAMNLNAADA